MASLKPTVEEIASRLVRKLRIKDMVGIIKIGLMVLGIKGGRRGWIINRTKGWIAAQESE
jgi:hypothetical protein